MNAEKSVKEFFDGGTSSHNAYFIGTTLKDPIGYEAGEPIIFKIKVVIDNESDVKIPLIRYSIESDDGFKSDGYITVSDDGWFYIKTSVERDGFVHVIAEACDENKNIIENIDKFEGGAGANIEKIRCETDIPDDYTEFWETVKKEGYSIQEEVIFKEQFETEKGFIAYDMRYKTKYGDFLSLTYTYPENAKPGTLKLLFIYMGYGVGDATPICREGYLCVRVNCHDIYNRQPAEYYEQLRMGKYFRYGFDCTENKLPETTYWKKVFVRNMQALNYFRQNPLINNQDVEFEGGSQAAMQACNMAANSGVATALRINVPWACDLFAIRKQHRINIDWRLPECDGLRYFDTAVAAKYLKCPVYIEAGLGDYICPPSGQMAMYNGITAPKKIRFIQNRTHPYIPFKFDTSERIDGYVLPDWSFDIS